MCLQLSKAKSFLVWLFCLLLMIWAETRPSQSKPVLCSLPPTWTFYDVVSHLAWNQSRYAASHQSTVNMSYSDLNLSLNATTQSPLFLSSPLNFSLHDKVTLIALTNLKDNKLQNRQLIDNLESIYRQMVSVQMFQNIRFILVNSKDSYNPQWVLSARSQVSFEVYQELSSSPVSSLLDGGNGDIFIYDRCGLLSYYIPFPLSFIHTQDPFLKATVLAAYTDSPCKKVCHQPNSTHLVNPSLEVNDSSTSVMFVSTLPAMPTTDSTTSSVNNMESPIENATSSPAINSSLQAPHEQASPALNVTLNGELNIIVGQSVLLATNASNMASNNTTESPNAQKENDNLIDNQIYDHMGKVLQNFYDLFRRKDIDHETSNGQPNVSIADQRTANNTVSMTTTAATPTLTLTTQKESLPDNPLSTTSLTNQTNSQKLLSNLSMAVNPIDQLARPQPNVTMSTGFRSLAQGGQSAAHDCNKTVCSEWSTERLLKARLCCLNFPNEDEEELSTDSKQTNGTIDTLEPVAMTNGGGFGCQLFARARCSQILPIIKCCTRKLVSEYFDYKIKQREQQQKKHMNNNGITRNVLKRPRSLSNGRDNDEEQSLSQLVSGLGLPGALQPNYVKQQHRKRLNKNRQYYR